MDKEETERRLTDLEIRLSYLEKTLETLDAVVVRMRDALERQEETQRQLVDQVAGSLSQLNADGRNDPPPPHY